jgi:hypothetical protein
MANVNITPGSGDIVLADVVTDATLGNVAAKVQYVKLVGGAVGNTNKVIVDAAGNLMVNIGAGLLPQGQAPMTASGPAVLANNHSTLAVAPDATQLLIGASGIGSLFKKIGINITTATTTANVIAGVSGQKIRIVSMYLVTGIANVVKLQSSSGTPTDGGCSYGANGGISLAYNPAGWFDTAANDGLTIVTGSAGPLNGTITYVQAAGM